MSRLFLGVLLALAACKPKLVEADCVTDSDCGESAICEEGGTCRSVECLTVHDCVFGDYCDDDYTCSEGCGSDLDCLAGETCEDNECEAYGCRDTQLDCPVGQFCQDGECQQDTRGHCEECDAGAVGFCSENTPCVPFETTGNGCTYDSDCPQGFTCDNLGFGRVCHLDRCLVACNPNAEHSCPRGMSCVQALVDSNETFCLGDCEFLLSEGAF